MLSGLPITGITKQANSGWLFEWNTTSASYYRIVLNGTELARVNGTSFVPALPEYSKYPPPLEIMEEETPALSEQYLPYLIIQWYGEECDYYSVREYSNLSWKEINRVKEEGFAVYTSQTPILEDDSSHTYGVFAYSKGLWSPVQEFTVYMVTPPVWVEGSVEIGYNNDTQEIIVSSRT